MSPRQRSWLLPAATLFLIAGVLVGRDTSTPWFAMVAVLPAVAGIVLLRGRLRFAACLVLSMVLGTVAGSLAWHPMLPPEGEYAVRGIVCDEIRSGSFGQVRVRLSDVTLNGRDFSAGAYWTFYTDDDVLPDGLEPGKMVSFRAELYHPSVASNPDGYDQHEYLLRNGITIGLYGCGDLSVSGPDFFSFSGFTASLRHRLTQEIVRRMGEETGAYTAALLLGQRSLIPSEDRDAFARLGIAHILSVSGFHVGILVGILGFLFRLLNLRPGLRLVLNAVILGFYCALCAWNPPVIRASLLFLVSAGGRLLNRPRTGIHSLCAVFFCMLLASPVQLTGASFLLTFGAMLGIVLVTPGIEQHNPFSARFPRGIWNSLAVLAGAQLGILLPELYFYQQLPLLGLLVNIPATVFATGLIGLNWLFLLFLPVPGLSDALAAVVSWLTSLLTGASRLLASLPGVSLWLPAPTWITAVGVLLAAAALCSMLRLSRRVRAALLAAGLALGALSFLPVPHTASEYIQFSAGNADAALLWDRDQLIVVDTGLEDGALSGFLRRRRLTPDAVILTHLHTDHVGGLRSMISDGIPVRLIYLPAGAEDQLIHEDVRALLAELRASGTEIRYLGKGDVLPLPSGSITVLWPETGRTRRNQDANQYSLVSLLSLNGVTFLHTGDITGEYESYSAVPADILKAAHHGSSGSSSAEYLASVSPRTVILSCRDVRRHRDFAGRMPPESALFSTAVSGALTLRFEDRQYTVIPFLPDTVP